jgi:hypothetical protein
MDIKMKNLIIERIGSLPKNTRFNLPDLLGEDWPGQGEGATTLGANFRNNLHDFIGVVDAGKASSNLRRYKKT